MWKVNRNIESFISIYGKIHFPRNNQPAIQFVEFCLHVGLIENINIKIFQVSLVTHYHFIIIVFKKGLLDVVPPQWF